MGLRGEGIDRVQTLLGYVTCFFCLYFLWPLWLNHAHTGIAHPLPLAQVKIKNQINQALIIMVPFFKKFSSNRKLLPISPGLIQVRKGFWVGL